METQQKAIQSALDQMQKSIMERVESAERVAYEAKKTAHDLNCHIGMMPIMGLGGGSSEDEGNREHKTAFGSYLRQGDAAGLKSIERKAMNRGSDPDGGYLVLPEMDKTIDRIAETISPFYRLANNVTIGTARYEKLVKTSGMTAARVAEGGTNGEVTEPKYSKVIIDAHTAEVEPWVYNETLDDAFVNLEQDLANEAGISFAELAGSEFITGTGITGAKGILDYTPVANASYSWGKVGYVATTKSGAFASAAPGDAIINLAHALPAKYRQGACFLMNDSTLCAVRQLKDGSGSYYLWQPDASAPFGGKLLGFPVEVDANMPSIGAGAYAIAFANLKAGYTIANRQGVTVIRDDITAKGTTKFNFRKRWGGGITNFEAIRLLKFATG